MTTLTRSSIFSESLSPFVLSPLFCVTSMALLVSVHRCLPHLHLRVVELTESLSFIAQVTTFLETRKCHEA